ncbi:uncharacterized protein LOC120844514 [Ixodes scapularis]|uniref:uncharacterized protein LOC120844514 n=1 Tax=Ixodes scapularis TaxID=6945 RepID=UPI001A9E8088|nr:uncharacterized protein LOC120844514 [Ixodes scapularis]
MAVGDDRDTFKLVSIEKLFSNLLQLKKKPQLFIHAHNPNLTNAGYKCYRDFRDENVYEGLQDVVGDAFVTTLFEILYSDEVKIANPLGAKRAVHKLTTMYLTFFNMHPRYKSRLGFVDLVVLAKFKDVEELGCQGPSVTVDGVPETVKVIVVAVCGDNLSQHKLGGFSASFSQGHICRYFTATTANLHAVTSEEQCQIMTRADDSSHLAAAKENPQDGRKLHGVVGPSPMAQLAHFDVTTQVAPDMMQDLFEGASAHIIGHVTKGLIDEGALTLEDLKREENTHWSVLLQLPNIVTLVLSEKITEDWVAYLEVLVKDFVEAFTAMYPTAEVLPKMHYMVHYARLTAALVFLRQYWCLRFERNTSNLSPWLQK